jgi:hypothetical protein
MGLQKEICGLNSGAKMLRCRAYGDGSKAAVPSSLSKKYLTS